jgi:hypothetical protein
VKWLEPHFTANELGPCDVVLSRHVDILRADTKLKAIFGGASASANRIQMVPLGKLLDSSISFGLFATLPVFDRQPAPGTYVENITVRDVIRFKGEKVSQQEPLNKPTLGSLLGYIVYVVTRNGQLVTDLGGGNMAPLVSRCNLSAVEIVPVEPENADMLLELRVDFTYEGVVSRNVNRLFAQVTS